MHITERRPWLRYVVAIAIIAAAAAVRWFFLGALGVKAPYMTFYPAVMITTLLCGFPSGILATLLSALLVSYFWNEPLYQLAILNPGDRLAMITFILCCSVVVYLTDVLRRAEKRGMIAEVQLNSFSEREHLVNMLQQSEERYRTVVEDQTEMICRFKDDGKLTFVNEVYCRVFGKTKDELIGNKWHPVAFPDDIPNVEEQLRKLSASNSIVSIENRVYTGTGDVRWMQFVNRGIFDTEGRLIETQSVGRDITDKKIVDEALRESEERFRSLNRKLLNLSEHMETVVEQERLSISRDIHDEIGQNLTVLKLDLEWFESHMPIDSSDLHARIKEMHESVVLLTATVQRIAADLRPPLLDNLGLAAAIEWHVDEFRKRTGLECYVMLNNDIDLIDQAASTAVMRIVQEGLTNVARHAQASEVTVSLCRENENILLEISDNGCGITPEQIASPNSYGLMGMQERARICRGNMEISGKPDSGTILTITIPFDTGEGTL